MASNAMLTDLAEQLETERLVLRIPNMGEGATVNAVVIESIAELSKWMPWANPTPDVHATETWCRQTRAKFVLGEEAQYVLRWRDDDTVVGACGVWRTNASVPRCEVGYWVRTSHTRRGIAAEAATAVSRVAFDTFGAERVEIRCDDRNDASGRVASKCGYALEGVLRRNERDPAGELRDTRVYARIRTS